jgi:hypothetical protein
MIQLIIFSEKEEIIPQCPNIKCKGFYLISNLKKLDKSHLELYCSACLKYLKKDKGIIASKENEKEKLIQKLVKERLEFINNTYPKAIGKTIQIAFRSKANKLEKDKINRVNENIEASKRKCMNLLCNGYLNKELVCLLCETKFCEECEEPMFENHKCKKELVENIKSVKNIVHCPKCNIPIEKSAGCNGMTCASCKYMFDYRSGSVSYHGSHNVQIQSQKEYTLLDEYKNKLSNESIELLFQFQQLKPIRMNDKHIINELKKYMERDDIKTAKRISKLFEKYQLSVYKYKHYINVSHKLEDSFKKGKFDHIYIKKAIDDINGFI